MKAIAKRERVDVMARLLADKRSENTRRAYRCDLNDFFTTVTGSEATPEKVQEFLNLSRGEANRVVLEYKAELLERGLAEATVNRRLAALRSLVSYARVLGAVDWELDVSGEPVTTYRDTRGVTPADIRAILAGCNLATLKGKRDYALLRLLWDNALRRGEIVKLNVGDFDAQARRLAILGKGKGSQKEWIDLSARTAQALSNWLQARREAYGDMNPADALFVAVDNATGGARLSTTGVYNLVRDYSAEAGIDRTMSPHRIRHSSITAALEATNGNVVAVQRLSRHAKVETVMVYEDNRRAYQAEVTNLLAAMA
jgi:integrase/recombinase XerC